VSGACGTHGREQKPVQGFCGKAPKKRLHLRRRCRWEDGIEMDLREIGWGGGGVEWFHLAQDRVCWRAVVNAVINVRVLAPRS
jgi:hypothetical protein